MLSFSQRCRHCCGQKVGKKGLSGLMPICLEKGPWRLFEYSCVFLTFKLGTPIMGGCSSSLLLLLLALLLLLLALLLLAAADSMVVKLLFRMLLLMLIQVEFDSAKLLRVRLPTKWWFLQKWKQFCWDS